MGLFDRFRRRDPKDEFAQAILTAIRQRGWGGGLEYHRDRFEIRADKAVHYLGNIFRDYQASNQDDRLGIIEAASQFPFLQKQAPPKDFDAAAPRLLSAVRNRFHLANWWMVEGLEATRGAHEKSQVVIAGPLAHFLVLEYDLGAAYVGDEQLGGWGVTLEEAGQVAVANLHARTELCCNHMDAGFFVCQTGDDYAAAPLLFPDMFDAMNLKGAPVAIVLSRRDLLVAGSEDREALVALAESVESAFAAETRPISQCPIFFKDGAWRPFQPDPPIPAIDKLHLLQALCDYEEQKELLDGYHQRIGLDVYAADLHGQQVADRYSTWTSWALGVDSLLPKADMIAMTGEEEVVLMRAWDDVMALCGDLVIPAEGFLPSRWRVNHGPPPETWAALKALPDPRIG
ncbi:hypothetical protein BH11PSE2_BH11PSE2_19330 [soil metagenome]